MERGSSEAAGRDPGSIDVSVGIVIQDPRTLDRNGPNAIVGRAEQIAEAIGAWREEGVDEVMCRLEPPSAGVVETIADAAQAFRASRGQ